MIVFRKKIKLLYYFIRIHIFRSIVENQLPAVGSRVSKDLPMTHSLLTSYHNAFVVSLSYDLRFECHHKTAPHIIDFTTLTNKRLVQYWNCAKAQIPMPF